MPEYVSGFARELAAQLGIPFLSVIEKTRETEPQKRMENSAQQVGNLLGAFSVERGILSAPVILVDDVIDSGWTMTMIAALLRMKGFSVGAAMGRNKIIYGASDYSVVVSSDYQKGGTWAGAVETLTAGWCPVFVRSGTSVGPGNKGFD